MVRTSPFWDAPYNYRNHHCLPPYKTSWSLHSAYHAAGLKELGLQVSFHSDPDEDIGGFEMRGYQRLKRLGVPVRCAIDLSELLAQRRRGRIPIVLYNTSSDSGHFSIILGTSGGTLRLAEGQSIPREEFLAAWTAPRILKQCVIVWK